MKANIEFKVVARSQNTNSFGLRQLVLLAKDGTVCKACFNSLNSREIGQNITGEANILHGEVLSVYFPGGELPELLPEKAPKKVIKEYFS